MPTSSLTRASSRPKRERRRFARNRQLAEYIGVSEMTLWRWKRDPALNFPPASVINKVEWNNLDLVDDWMASRAVQR